MEFASSQEGGAMSNLEIWDKFADIDPKFTKPITGKSYKGTSPNPQYVIRCMTEMFGPVGQGFGWEVLQEGFVPLGDEILHWCRIRFWHTNRDNFFESYGQTKALMKTRNGLMSDEDAPKKSLTDAIIKAASHVGIAANIFLGRWDDQKYVEQVAESFSEPSAKPPATGSEQAKPTSAAEMKRGLEAIDNDLIDCHSIADVDKCAKVWAAIIKRDGWAKDYRDIAAPKFQARRDQINAAQDDPFSEAAE
jgi:hypothetical protein